MALGGSNKTLVITTRFDADSSGYFREVEKLTGKSKQAQAEAEGLAKSLGDRLKFDKLKEGIGALGAELGGTAQKMAQAAQHGMALGAVFGPMGTAIGGAAGALVGLVRSTNAQTEAEKRAAEAARKHADELQRVYEGETKIRSLRRGTREAEELAQEELNQARLNATRLGLGPDSPDIERARRALRELEAEREALNRSDGVIWLEQRKRELERLNAIKDIEAARRKGTITDEDAARRLKDLNKVEGDSLDVIGKYKEKQKETAETVERLNKALQAGQIDAKTYNALLRAADEEYRQRDDERKEREKQAIARAKALAEERRKAANEWTKSVTDDLVKQLENEVEYSSVTSPIGKPTDYTAGFDIQERYRQETVANDNLLVQRQAMAEAVQREIDLQREYASVVGQAYEAIVSGSSGVLSTFQNLAKQQIVALGVREAVEAASQLGYGFGALANPLFAGAAAMHFTSAAKHAAAAALAGVGVAAVGAIGGGGSSNVPGYAGAGNGGGGRGGGGGGGGGTGAPTVTNYYIVGDSYTESARMRQRNAERVVELGTQRTSAGRAE